MGSESLFTKCKICGKDISATARTCPGCGAKQKKLSVIHWVGIALLGFMGIGLFNSSDKANQEGSKVSTAKVAEIKLQSFKAPLPQEETLFIKSVSKFANSFRKAKNELQESALREQRKQEIAILMAKRRITSWVGKISQLKTNTEGKAILAIRISPDIEIKTWNNALSDTSSNTLIDKGSPIYSSLFELSTGQQVMFSGSFFTSETDYVKETSMTIQGSMRNPEFLFKFTSIEPLN